MLDSNSFKGRTALVSGSTKGIGLATAEYFAKNGANVVICARSKAEEIAHDFKQLGYAAIGVSADLTTKEGVSLVIEKAVSGYGTIDILVNNCGGLGGVRTGEFMDLTEQDWLDCYSLNVLTAVNFCQLAMAYLKQSSSARIINISSVTAIQPGSFNPHYAFNKAGLINLSKYLSNYLADHNITVNCISPGMVATEGWEEYIQNKAIEECQALELIAHQENARAVGNVPLKRFGSVGEIAALVGFLASEEASYITGSNFVIDGGKIKTC
ncbi:MULTISPECIES: SDR family oxidoreductase [unclassified Oleiphilus]|uniref:SDR family oxidoreductase n=1 Tax=unclassified Oleiphilus TaxID=2631174 RepID=UPI0007C2FF9A|nr:MULTISPECIES: SDR family oxidoreductase [unclassified Oleiphilus]KZZ37458.1 hypothetical protein A3757_11240 [Oleiphilus sp. HI0117]KZZ54152.1 hypothetical protein A3761_15075 [Oleiphilus sp. HI0123]